MTVPEDMAERHGRLLARYAELSLSLAEDVHAAALAAEDPDQKARLASGFHKLGRALRQSVALEAKFVRDRAADQRAAEACAAETARAAVRRRQDQVRAALERRLYEAVDAEDAPDWLADLDERLDEAALYDGFADESVEDQVARLSAALGFAGASDVAPAVGETIDPDDEDDGETPDVTPPEPPERPPAPEPPPDPAPMAPPEAPPDPPPDPYVPPWERPTNGRHPGGSGY